MIFSGNKYKLVSRRDSGKKNEMERVCEFCTDFTPVVYCKADAANLCLSCDAKVHSANALSSRHLRTLLCDSCRHRPCTVRCLDHCMFICHVCNGNLHGVSSQHQRRVVNCYTGCPSAKDFAVMWGFKVNHDNVRLKRSYDSVVSKGRSEMLVSFDGSDTGSSGKKKKGKLQRDSGFILEQILELEKLQLSEKTVALHLAKETDSSNVHQQSKERVGDIPLLEKELMADFSQASLPQIEPLSSYSAADNNNSFWQSKGTSKNYQLWYQNLQDIGVCEETECGDDFDIPDIDLTFRNFDEIFGADQEMIVGQAITHTNSVSSFETGISDNCNARAPEMKIDPSLFDGMRQSIEKTEDSLLAFNPTSRLMEKKKAKIEEDQTHYIPINAKSQQMTDLP